MKGLDFFNLEDGEIITRILRGNEPGLFEILYNRYAQKVMYKCYSLLKEKLLAEEFTQDIFARAFEKLSSFKQKSTFSTWLYAITTNYCIGYLRWKRRFKHFDEWEKNFDLAEEEPGGDETNGKELHVQQLNIVLEALQPQEKALLIMRYQDKLSLRGHPVCAEHI